MLLSELLRDRPDCCVVLHAGALLCSCGEGGAFAEARDLENHLVGRHNKRGGRVEVARLLEDMLEKMPLLSSGTTTTVAAPERAYLALLPESEIGVTPLSGAGATECADCAERCAGFDELQAHYAACHAGAWTAAAALEADGTRAPRDRIVRSRVELVARKERG